VEQQYAFLAQQDDLAIVLAPVVAGDALCCVIVWPQQAASTEQQWARFAQQVDRANVSWTGAAELAACLSAC